VQADIGWHKPIQRNEERLFPDATLVSAEPVWPALQWYILSQASPLPPEPGMKWIAKAVPHASAAGASGSAPMPAALWMQPVARC